METVLPTIPSPPTPRFSRRSPVVEVATGLMKNECMMGLEDATAASDSASDGLKSAPAYCMICFTYRAGGPRSDVYLVSYLELLWESPANPRHNGSLPIELPTLLASCTVKVDVVAPGNRFDSLSLAWKVDCLVYGWMMAIKSPDSGAGGRWESPHMINVCLADGLLRSGLSSSAGGTKERSLAGWLVVWNAVKQTPSLVLEDSAIDSGRQEEGGRVFWYSVPAPSVSVEDKAVAVAGPQNRSRDTSIYRRCTPTHCSTITYQPTYKDRIVFAAFNQEVCTLQYNYHNLLNSVSMRGRSDAVQDMEVVGTRSSLTPRAPQLHFQQSTLLLHPSCQHPHYTNRSSLRDTAIMIDPVKDFSMPHQTVLAVLDPNPQSQYARAHPVSQDASLLQDIEQHDPLRHRQPIVKTAVDDEMRCREIAGVVDGVPAVVVVAVVPEGAVELVLRKPQLLRVVHAQKVGRTIVRDEGFELSSQIVPLDPIGHVPAIRGPSFDSPIGVDVAEILVDVFPHGHQVFVWISSPLVLDGVLVSHAPASGACRIGRNHHISLVSPGLEVPSSTPRVVLTALRPAMDNESKGIFVAFVESFGENQEALDRSKTSLGIKFGYIFRTQTSQFGVHFVGVEEIGD
ncbi:hypothetical protein KCU88_g378, partial [Aureobasidium melanogenum]